MTQAKRTILIIEDDLDIADMLNAYFRVQGYEVHTVNWGEDGVRACQSIRPDLIILDIRLPDIDGYEVARQLRANRRTENIPIIFLTEKRHRDDRLKGLELGADDYITKPFDIQELRLRVRNSLERFNQGSLNNPVTGLPEGALVDEHLANCIDNPNDVGILLVSLENLENFREAYGFVASDDVLRAVSLMVHNSMSEPTGEHDFLGHLETARFVLTTEPNQLDELQEKIETRLLQSLDYFYPLKDRDSQNLPEKRLNITIGNYVLSSDEAIRDPEKLKTRLLNTP